MHICVCGCEFAQFASCPSRVKLMNSSRPGAVAAPSAVCLFMSYPICDYFLLMPARSRLGMGLYNQIFTIANHVTGLLFSFLLPHFFTSVHVRAGSVSANSVAAILGAFCKPLPLCHSSQYHIGCHFLGCLSSPAMPTLLFHPKAD